MPADLHGTHGLALVPERGDLAVDGEQLDDGPAGGQQRRNGEADERADATAAEDDGATRSGVGGGGADGVA